MPPLRDLALHLAQLLSEQRHLLRGRGRVKVGVGVGVGVGLGVGTSAKGTTYYLLPTTNYLVREQST